jgi:VCBS repeat-containing protein
VLDAETLPQAIVYTVVTAPAHGRLSLGAFTQADIDERRLTYRHDGGESTRDEFSFTVDDGSGSGIGTQTLKMEITPVNDGPVVPVLETPQVQEGQLLVLELRAEDPEGATVSMTVLGLPVDRCILDGG